MKLETLEGITSHKSEVSTHNHALWQGEEC